MITIAREEWTIRRAGASTNRGQLRYDYQEQIHHELNLREGRGKGIERIDHLSKRTTRKGNWLPSLYLPLMYGRVKTLYRRRECENYQMGKGAGTELTRLT